MPTGPDPGGEATGERVVAPGSDQDGSLVDTVNGGEPGAEPRGVRIAPDETVRVVLEELKSLRDRGPEEAELEVAKEHLKGSLMLSLESTASRMSNLARQEIYFGRQFTLEETLKGIAPVTARDAQRLSRDLFHDGHLALAALGNLSRFKTRAERLRL